MSTPTKKMSSLDAEYMQKKVKLLRRKGVSRKILGGNAKITLHLHRLLSLGYMSLRKGDSLP
jgi:hypothetical protein